MNQVKALLQPVQTAMTGLVDTIVSLQDKISRLEEELRDSRSRSQISSRPQSLTEVEEGSRTVNPMMLHA